MSLIFVFCAMLFAHIVDDFYLQGILADMKQKAWWSERTTDELYRHDYIVALLMHGMSWSFMVMLPIGIYYGFQCGSEYLISMVVNAFAHAYVDNEKANRKSINLIEDQFSHFGQILITFAVLCM